MLRPDGSLILSLFIDGGTCYGPGPPPCRKQFTDDFVGQGKEKYDSARAKWYRHATGGDLANITTKRYKSEVRNRAQQANRKDWVVCRAPSHFAHVNPCTCCSLFLSVVICRVSLFACPRLLRFLAPVCMLRCQEYLAALREEAELDAQMALFAAEQTAADEKYEADKAVVLQRQALEVAAIVAAATEKAAAAKMAVVEKAAAKEAEWEEVENWMYQCLGPRARPCTLPLASTEEFAIDLATEATTWRQKRSKYR